MNYDDQEGMRSTPATEYEFYLLRKHRDAGTAPSMPKWYQAHWRRCIGRGYTAICEARVLLFDALADSKRRLSAPVIYSIPDARTTKCYVREFCKLNNLR